MKRMPFRKGEQLLIEYCNVNGFDYAAQWKRPTHAKHWLAYRKQLNKIISTNWISFHPTRGNDKYSVWIDLITGEIRETLKY